MPFARATKTQRKAHIALIGPTGSGKTLTALKIAQRFCEEGKRIALIDTENGSASLYSDDFAFDCQQLESFSPREYIRAIHEAEAAGEYGVLIIDSLSHAWAGKDGVLEMVDKAAKRSGSGNTFGAWRDATPEHNDLVEALVRCKLDLVVTMRSKMAYVQERDEKTGKTTVRKVGLQPVQRDGLEYELDLVADMDVEHHFMVAKTRCSLLDGLVVLKPDGDVIEPFRAWLRDGAPAPERSAPEPQRERAPEPQPSSAPTNGHRNGSKPAPSTTEPCSEKQRSMLYALAGKADFDAATMALIVQRVYGADSSRQLTKAQASDLIDRLQQIERGEMSSDDLVAMATIDHESDEPVDAEALAGD